MSESKVKLNNDKIIEWFQLGVDSLADSGITPDSIEIRVVMHDDIGDPIPMIDEVIIKHTVKTILR